MCRPSWKVVWTLSFAICTVLRVPAQGRGAPTCDPRALDADSYALMTRGIAEVVLDERTSWWDGFIVGRHAEALSDLNFSATSVAEHALRLDDRNLLAHATLARQYVILAEDAEVADAAWRTVLDHGGAVAWTATLYDVDVKSYFVVAFDRAALGIYRYGELARTLREDDGDGEVRRRRSRAVLARAGRLHRCRRQAGSGDPVERRPGDQGRQLDNLVQAESRDHHRVR